MFEGYDLLSGHFWPANMWGEQIPAARETLKKETRGVVLEAEVGWAGTEIGGAKRHGQGSDHAPLPLRGQYSLLLAPQLNEGLNRRAEPWD